MFKITHQSGQRRVLSQANQEHLCKADANVMFTVETGRAYLQLQERGRVFISVAEVLATAIGGKKQHHKHHKGGN